LTRVYVALHRQVTDSDYIQNIESAFWINAVTCTLHSTIFYCHN